MKKVDRVPPREVCGKIHGPENESVGSSLHLPNQRKSHRLLQFRLQYARTHTHTHTRTHARTHARTRRGGVVDMGSRVG